MTAAPGVRGIARGVAVAAGATGYDRGVTVVRGIVVRGIVVRGTVVRGTTTTLGGIVRMIRPLGLACGITSRHLWPAAESGAERGSYRGAYRGA